MEKGSFDMRRLTIMLGAAIAILLAGAFAGTVEAQTSRGAFNIPAAAKNFTPIEKAACGPFRGRYCGPFHHLVCGPYHRHCWCARC